MHVFVSGIEITADGGYQRGGRSADPCPQTWAQRLRFGVLAGDRIAQFRP